jgi:probable F420-dependent oxidoreductase
MSRSFQVSVTVAGLGFLYADDLAAMVDLARLADETGVDQLVVTDHVVMGPNTDRYPYGPFPMPENEPWPEPLTVLAAMAGASEKVRLGTGILITPLRSGVLLAKSLATLDVLSRGRLDVGVGVGWQREEYEASGIAFEERWLRLDEGLATCRALWSEAPAAFTGKTASFREIRSFPQPLQPGGPPLWFGVGLGPTNLARIARHGAGWMPMDSSPAALRDGAAKLRGAFAEAGRSFDGFGIRASAPLAMDGKRPDLDATLARIPEVVEAGATSISLALPVFVRSRDEIPAFFEKIGRA